jgi:hypothetical protein
LEQSPVEDAAAMREAWARQIVQHQAAVAVQRRYPTGRIDTLRIERCEITAPDADRLRCLWQARGELSVPRMFRSPQTRTCNAAGAFTQDFDRFHRPTAWHQSAVEIVER